ncbi:DUF1045 domain-containing protein [Bradyrhizobium sp.]|uniref:DUF1045 domain-containing protein n=1 Tax=Bradyrhizobium sp. TaxID=376 RepID=UPI0040381C95
MTNFPRYAIYFAAEPGSALDRFGAELLGYDAHRGIDVTFPTGMGLPPDWREMTHDPRKYGFHATLKPPMALQAGKTESELIAACAGFAGTPRAIPAIKTVIDSIAGFVAILPAAPCSELESLAADCVRQFDSFRAPLTEQDRLRRNAAGLTARQRFYLDRWGYPYVFDEYRFHMTLTGRLDADRRASVLAMLQDRFPNAGASVLAIDSIALFRQEEAGRRFRVIGRWRLQRRSGERNALTQ